MSPTLKKQLSFLSVLAITGGVFQWVTTSTRAQETEFIIRHSFLGKRVPLSRDEAARNFALLLEFIDPSGNPLRWSNIGPTLASSISPSSDTPRVRDILILMAA